mgnify:CR=1 FL=1
MKPTMKAIAQTLDLSINAVSLALNDRPGVSEETRTLILETAEKMGYFECKAKYKKSFSSKHIGLLIMKKNYRTRFYSKVLYGIEKEANELGYYVIVKFLDDEELWTSMAEKKFCGLLVVGIVEEDTLERLNQYQLPIVLVDTTSYKTPLDCILTDNRIGTYESVNYLLEQGYKEVGFFGEFTYSHSFKERYWGYLEALMGKYNDLLAVNEISSKYSVLDKMDHYVIEYDVDAIVNIIRKRDILAKAYQCANDETANILCAALKTLGYRIPEDIAIIGFDDSEHANMMIPKLTTSHVKRTRMGQEAVDKLVWRMSHRKATTSKIMIPVELILRDSTRRCENE